VNLQPINFQRWIEENRHLLKPPVGNKTMTVGKDFIVMIVGGPNARTDYHVDPYEEWFYQIEGTMHVDLMVDGKPESVEIGPGDTWLLPGDTPHSPQRPETGSIGLVMERVREEGVLEKFQWYCPNCNALVHEVELQVRDIVVDLPPVFTAFYEDEAARVCKNCGHLHPGKG
jgi:3-hydroxyanthranilate 3,4-dioxygenase